MTIHRHISDSTTPIAAPGGRAAEPVPKHKHAEGLSPARSRDELDLVTIETTNKRTLLSKNVQALDLARTPRSDVGVKLQRPPGSDYPAERRLPVQDATFSAPDQSSSKFSSPLDNRIDWHQAQKWLLAHHQDDRFVAQAVLRKVERIGSKQFNDRFSLGVNELKMLKHSTRPLLTCPVITSLIKHAKKSNFWMREKAEQQSPGLIDGSLGGATA